MWIGINPDDNTKVVGKSIGNLSKENDDNENDDEFDANEKNSS